MKKISPIKFSARWGKRLLYHFSKKTPWVQLSESSVAQEPNWRTSVGGSVLVLFGPLGNLWKAYGNS